MQGGQPRRCHPDQRHTQPHPETQRQGIEHIRRQHRRRQMLKGGAGAPLEQVGTDADHRQRHQEGDAQSAKQQRRQAESAELLQKSNCAHD